MTPEKLRVIYADFRNWLFRVWQFLGLPDPTALQYDMAMWVANGPRRRILEAFRGAAKSWVTAAFVLWLILQDPDHKVMVVSASKSRADAFSVFVKRLIAEMPELLHLAARPGQRDSMIEFDVGPAKADQSPSVKSVGIMGQLTGSRANTIVADDVEVPNNAETPGQREKLSERVKEFDAILKPGGQVIYLGTPQTEETLYAKLEQRGYQTRIYPARVPGKKQREAYGDRLAPFVEALCEKQREGAPVEPSRFTEADLTERAISYGSAGFQLQFMLDPSLSDADRYPLKLADFVVMDIHPELAPARIVWSSDPHREGNSLPMVGLTGDKWCRPFMVSEKTEEWVPYQQTIMAIDPAGKGKDEASYVIISFHNGNIFLRAVGGFLHGYEEKTLKGFAEAAKAHKVGLILVESNFGDGMFSELLKPVLKKEEVQAGIEDVRSVGQKELRIIDTLEPVLSGHRLLVDPKVIRADYESVSSYPADVRHTYRLFYQLSRISRARGALSQDGRLDALSIAVSHFREQMARDQDDAVKAAREAAFDKELEALIRSVGGRVPSGPTWVRLPGAPKPLRRH